MNTAENQIDLFDKTSREDLIIQQAIKILESRATYHVEKQTVSCPDDMKKLARLRLANLEHEVFLAVFLDNRHQVIATDELFRGTVDGAAVYPREVVKEALRRNAAAVVFAHNHPSGNSEPSTADGNITKKLVEALNLVDVRVLDHIVVGDDCTSMAELGII